MSEGSQHLTLWGGEGREGSQFNTMSRDSRAISKKHDQQVPKNQCGLTYDLINFELTHVPTMIFFPLFVGQVLKNGMPDHIFLSSFRDSCTRYHEEKRKLNMRQGFPYCKGFEKVECPGIFFSLLSMIPARYHWEKKETKQEAGFY